MFQFVLVLTCLCVFVVKICCCLCCSCCRHGLFSRNWLRCKAYGFTCENFWGGSITSSSLMINYFKSFWFKVIHLVFCFRMNTTKKTIFPWEILLFYFLIYAYLEFAQGKPHLYQTFITVIFIWVYKFWQVSFHSLNLSNA